MLEGMTVLITGGGSGIGEATSKLMLDNGYKVFSVGLHTPTWTHDHFHAIELNLLDDSLTHQFAERLVEEQDITHFVHNAGVILPNL